MISRYELFTLANFALMSVAFIGAFSANCIRLMIDRRRPLGERINRDTIDTLFYLVGYPLIGAFLVLVYILEGTPLTPFLVMHIGITAPLTITALAGLHEISNSNGETNEERDDERFD